MDYQNGKIYKIISDSTDKIYIGCTCNPLNKRLQHHREDYKKWQNGKHHYITAYNIIANDDHKIELIEAFPCESKAELYIREKHWIKHYGDLVVNKTKPIRTEQEQKDYKRVWYQNNFERMQEKAKNRYNNLSEEKKEQLNQKSYAYFHRNKEMIAEKRQRRITCECGSVIRYCDKSKHYKTNKHKAFLK